MNKLKKQWFTEVLQYSEDRLKKQMLTKVLQNSMNNLKSSHSWKFY